MAGLPPVTLAVLAERNAASPLEVILFDAVIGAGWSWSQRDAAMARHLLAGSPLGARMLAVAGNAHTPTNPTDLGILLGAWLARQWPGIRQIQISYGSGRYWNSRSCQFARRASPHGPIRLHQDTGELVLDLPVATEAVVPSDRSHRHRQYTNHPKCGKSGKSVEFRRWAHLRGWQRDWPTWREGLGPVVPARGSRRP